MFGHVKGAFTGAESQRSGFLEATGQYGSVFLDEIGELDPGLQVKLLRVLQSRQFQRIGDTKTRDFKGKIISATNRHLLQEIHEGRFREDFYYRICSDMIETPSLIEQLNDSPGEIEFLVQFLCGRIAPGEKDELARDVLKWFREKQPAGYHWSVNMRQLEQCVRNTMIHNDYVPQTKQQLSVDASESLASSIRETKLTADQLLCKYCQVAYEKVGSYEKAAELLALDRRTVKAKIISLNS